MNDSLPPSKVTLEDLLRLKRAERPPAEFWTRFESDFRSRQLAAAVEKRRWWFSLPALSRLSMPVGAAAVLAVTFLVIRDYQQPAIEPDFAPGLADAAGTGVSQNAEAINEGAAIPAVADADAGVLLAATQPVLATEQAVEAEMVVTPNSPRARLGDLITASREERISSPSARTIVANLEASQPELAQFLDRRMSATRLNAIEEPLASVTSPRDERISKLFPEMAQIAGYAGALDRTVSSERSARRINEAQLTDTVRRLHASGNSLSLKIF